MEKEKSGYKIGVFGSAVTENEGTMRLARELGESLAEMIVVTGACSGVPYEIANVAKEKGAWVIGYSPESDLKAQERFTPDDDLGIYDELVYVEGNFPYSEGDMARKKHRNVMSTRAVDAGLIVAGRWGTLNEFTNLFDMGKVIGVLIGTGGIADELEDLSRRIKKKSEAKVIFDSSPKDLVRAIIAELENRK